MKPKKKHQLQLKMAQNKFQHHQFQCEFDYFTLNLQIIFNKAFVFVNKFVFIIQKIQQKVN